MSTILQDPIATTAEGMSHHGQDAWWQSYADLCGYLSTHQNTYPANRRGDADSRRVYAWIQQTRRDHRRLDARQIDALDRVDFPWLVSPRRVQATSKNARQFLQKRHKLTDEQIAANPTLSGLATWLVKINARHAMGYLNPGEVRLFQGYRLLRDELLPPDGVQTLSLAEVVEKLYRNCGDVCKTMTQCGRRPAEFRGWLDCQRTWRDQGKLNDEERQHLANIETMCGYGQLEQYLERTKDANSRYFQIGLSRQFHRLERAVLNEMKRQLERGEPVVLYLDQSPANGHIEAAVAELKRRGFVETRQYGRLSWSLDGSNPIVRLRRWRDLLPRQVRIMCLVDENTVAP